MEETTKTHEKIENCSDALKDSEPNAKEHEESPWKSMSGKVELFFTEDEFRNIIREDKTLCRNWLSVIREKLDTACSIVAIRHRLRPHAKPNGKFFVGYARCRYKACCASFKIAINWEPDFSVDLHAWITVSWNGEHVYSIQEELLIQRGRQREGTSRKGRLSLRAEMISFENSNIQSKKAVSFKRPPMMGKVEFFVSEEEFNTMFLDNKKTEECYNIIRSHLNSACNIALQNYYFGRNNISRTFTPYFSCQGRCTVKSCEAKYRIFIPEKPDFAKVPWAKVCASWNHSHTTTL